MLFAKNKIIEKIKTKFIFLGMMFVFSPICIFSQLNVSQSGVAAVLAQAIAGNGVTVSNAALNCGTYAAGTFAYSGVDLGLTGGILLTTGVASQASNPGTFLCSVNNGNNFSDPDLTALVPTADLDACILEFDFVPTCNSLNMNFVFGSEEYPQGVPLQYNDAFAIFLTGPNPSGGNYTAQNIATLPNGTPVSIHNVNAGTNAAYFVNNYLSPNNDIAYNGYTIPVTSVTAITPCSTYHMKVAIADAGNALYDSGVFISNNTLSCQNPAVITASSTPTGGCQNTGSAMASVTNYTGTVTYQWLPGGQTTSTINNLAAGVYTCNVSMHQPCGIITQSVTTTVLNTGNNIVLTSNQQNLICNGASNATATVTPVGGVSPYTCVWSTSPIQNGMTATNLSAGTYTATVTDNTGCLATIQVIIAAPLAMQLHFTTAAATCIGATGTASVTVVSGGTAPYTYSWNTNPVQNTQSAINLTTGSYIVTITDSHNCSTTGTATVATQNPSWTLAVATPTNVLCFGGNNGAVSATINNPGASTFTYLWNTNPPQNSQTISNLLAGNYSCTVTDNNGCVISVNVNVSQPALLTATVTTVPTMCTGSVGSASANASGGTQPYTYLWSNSHTTNIAQGLGQGQYSVTITDANNCTASAVATVGVINPTLQITQATSSSICGGPTGVVTILSVTPSNPPFSYQWATGQTTQNITNLLPGIYAVNVSDANGCVGSAAATVNINTTLPIQASATSDYCNKSIGSANIVANGNPPYIYQWSNSQTTQTANNLPAGSYTVQVTDAYNCKDSVAVTVININDVFTPAFSTQPGGDLYSQDPITIDLSINPVWVFTGGNLSDSTTITGLSMYHVFNQPGDYTATYYFTSTHGCKDSITYTIEIKDYSTLYIPNSFTPNYDGINDEFKAEGSLIQSFQMVIYDRWGNLITTLNDISQSWKGKYNGQDAPNGTYVYKGTAINTSGKQTNFSGQINLIR